MKNAIKNIGALFLMLVIIFPAVSLAGDKDIYVNANASGKEDGSFKRPFKKISDAIKEAEDASKDVKIHIAEGTYKENITIPKDTEIVGSNRDRVIIKADDDDEEVVKMKDDSEIHSVTIEGGKYGIIINDDDEASVINCVIKDNDKDGIKIEKASVDEKHKAVIKENKIYDNGGSGIYSEKRELSIEENEIINNDGDGIDIEAGSDVWIYDNSIKDNDKSGMKLILDDSEIWTKSNTIRDNKREGIEINAYGGAGRININKSKFYENDRYGITRVQRGNFHSNVWGGVTIEADNIFNENSVGTISSILKI